MASNTGKYNAEQRRQQERDCAELRLQSFSWDQISERTGLTRSTAFNRVRAYFKSQPPLDLEQYRTEMLTQYQIMLHALRDKIALGDYDAINAACRVLASVRALVGADAALKIETEVLVITPEDVELRGLLQQVESSNSVIRKEISA